VFYSDFKLVLLDVAKKVLAKKLGINTFEISINSVYFENPIDLFQNFFVIIALTANFECNVQKTLNFQTVCKK
jgi:hypothetical protein